MRGRLLLEPDAVDDIDARLRGFTPDGPGTGGGEDMALCVFGGRYESL